MLTKQYTQTARTGDPQVEIQLPQALYNQLLSQAKYNARDFKAEVIARLTQMMHYQHKQFVAGQMATEILSRLQAA